LRHKAGLREQKNQQLVNDMLLLYEKVDGIYGYRQLTINLRRQTGQLINHKRVYRLMKLAGIPSVIRKKKKKYVKSTPEQIAENLLNREFTASKSNEKWLTDVTDLNMEVVRKPILAPS
jgi:transposase InsO family protein